MKEFKLSIQAPLWSSDWRRDEAKIFNELPVTESIYCGCSLGEIFAERDLKKLAKDFAVFYSGSDFPSVVKSWMSRVKALEVVGNGICTWCGFQEVDDKGICLNCEKQNEVEGVMFNEMCI